MFSDLPAGCPNLPDADQVGTLTFKTNLVAGCDPVPVEHEVPGPAMAEVVRFFRPVGSEYENVPRQQIQDARLFYGGRLEPLTWARLKYFKPVFVFDFLGEAYVLDEDGALRFVALLNEYGKLPEELRLP